MNNTRTITFTATKGGTGTSTVAAITAIASGVKTLLVDQSQSRDLAMVVGRVPDAPVVSINDNLDLAVGDDYETDGYDLVVIDRGVDAKTVAGAENYLVTRRCYLALRKATMARRDYDGIVVIDEKDRALTVNDVSMVMTTKIAATVPYDPSISRAVDAGVLPERGEKFGEHVRGILARSAVPA